MFGVDIGNDRYVCHCTTIETILRMVNVEVIASNRSGSTYKVIRTTADRTDDVFQGLELDIIARSAGIQSLERIVGGILEDVERICDLEMTLHAVGLHDLGDIGCATSMAFQTKLFIHLGEARHEGHVVHFDGVLDYSQDWFVLVGHQALTDHGRGPSQTKSAVCHG